MPELVKMIETREGERDRQSKTERQVISKNKTSTANKHKLARKS